MTGAQDGWTKNTGKTEKTMDSGLVCHAGNCAVATCPRGQLLPYHHKPRKRRNTHYHPPAGRQPGDRRPNRRQAEPPHYLSPAGRQPGDRRNRQRAQLHVRRRDDRAMMTQRSRSDVNSRSRAPVSQVSAHEGTPPAIPFTSSGFSSQRARGHAALLRRNSATQSTSKKRQGLPF